MLRLLLIFTFFLGITQLLLAGDGESELAASALRPINNVNWSTSVIKIVDSAGQPIEGARVRMRSLVANNGYGWWSDSTNGVPPIAISDLKGEAHVSYPRTVDPVHLYQVTSVAIEISHAKFCSKCANLAAVDLPPDIPVETLSPGVRLRVAAVVPGSDQPLQDCYALLEGGEVQEQEFVRQKDGWLNSITVRPERRWFRVIHAPPGQPIQFSRQQTWDPDDPKSSEIRVDVHPGVRVIGRVSDVVPRPITRGYVYAFCGSSAHTGNRDGAAEQKPIWWDEVTPIRPNGTFEFPSLPTGHLAQLFAYADDCVSAQPTDEAFETALKWFPTDTREDVRHSFRFGQVLRLVGKSQQMELQMELAGNARIRCIDAQGRPLCGIAASVWPNQVVFGGRGGIFCQPHSTLEQLQGKSDSDSFRNFPFIGETNSEGVAEIRSVPPVNFTLYAGTFPWSCRSQRWITDKEPVLEFKPGKTIEHTIELRRAD